MFKNNVLCMTIVFSLIGSIEVHGITLSFDNLFPITWYEKGMNATIYVWHKICSLFDGSLSQESESLDIILGKCAFAHFCLEKMSHKKQQLVAEDIDYFVSVLQALENKLMLRECDNREHEDKMMCLENIVVSMKHCLDIPSNIDTN